MKDSALEQGVTIASLGNLFRLIARRWYWIALAALLSAPLGVYTGWKLYTPHYTLSTALVAGYTLEEGPSTLAGDKLSPGELQDMTLSFAALLQTKQTQSSVIDKLGSDWDSTHYDDYIQIEVPDRSSLIQFTFRYRNAEDVLRMAQAMRETAMELGKPIWGDRYLHWVDRYDVPRDESQMPQMMQAAIVGGFAAIVGAVLGSLLSWLLGSLDDRIWNCDDEVLTARLPILCALPREKGGRILRDVYGRPISSKRLGVMTGYLQRIELLAAQIIRYKAEEHVKSALLVEPTHGCGSNFVIAQLAACLSRSSVRVLLIECNGSHFQPRLRLGPKWQMPSRNGTLKRTRQVFGEASINGKRVHGESTHHPSETAIRRVVHADGYGFDFLRADPRLESRPVADRLESVTQAYNAHLAQYDLVLFAVPPLLSNGETALLASRIDITIAVFRCRASTYKQFDATLSRLAGTRLIGSIWNSVEGGKRL